MPASELWIPSAATQEAPAFKCLTCGATFARSQKGRYIRHATQCSRSIEDDMNAYLEHKASNAFTGSIDPEADRWKSKRRAEGKPVTNGRGSLA